MAGGALKMENATERVRLRTRLEAIGLFMAGALVGLAVVVAPNVFQSFKHRNEHVAIESLKTIAKAESIFREGDKDGNGSLDYGTLAQLSQTQLIDGALGSGTKKGYVFAVGVSRCTSEFLWFATAHPLRPQITGDRYFCLDAGGVIFYTCSGTFALNTTDCVILDICHGPK